MVRIECSIVLLTLLMIINITCFARCVHPLFIPIPTILYRFLEGLYRVVSNAIFAPGQLHRRR